MSALILTKNLTRPYHVRRIFLASHTFPYSKPQILVLSTVMSRLVIQCVTVFFLVLFSAAFIQCKPREASSPSYNLTVGSTFGCDVSTLVLPDTFRCLKQQGIDFVIVRAYRSDCKFVLLIFPSHHPRYCR